MKEKKYPLMIIVAACTWGCMGILVRTLNATGLNTMEIVAIRSFVTLLVMVLGILLMNKDAFKIKLKDIWCFVGTGILSVVFFNFCYFKTIETTSLSVAAILLYTSPFFVTFMSAFVFQEKITIRKNICMIIAFIGCVFVTGALSGELVLSAKGILIGLGAGLGYALYSIFGKMATDRGYSSLTVTLYTFLFSSIGVLPFIKPLHMLEVYSRNLKQIPVAFLLIIITTVIPYICYTYGLSKTQPGIAGILATIEPVAATIVGMSAYHEIPDATTVIGIVLVFAAVAMINTKNCMDKKTK